MFVDFMATWCGPCKTLEKEVFQAKEFQKYKDDYVFVRVDIDQSPVVANFYRVEGIPDVRIIGPSGSEVKRFVGLEASPLIQVIEFMKP